MKNDISILPTPYFTKFSPSSSMASKKILPLNTLPGILMITTYPPNECGIATYSQDLLKALNNKFNHSFSLKVCALDAKNIHRDYPKEVKYTLNTSDSIQYLDLAYTINFDKSIQLVLIQHEFGLFQNAQKDAFLQFIYGISKPVVIVFHTVLPTPDEAMRIRVRHIAAACASIVVMTKNAAQLLEFQYGVPEAKIEVIAHGTHLVPHLDREELKAKYGLAGRKVLSTFGLLSSGKSIETTLQALPEIIKTNPTVTFLIIGKTHPSVVNEEGEKYRDSLEALVTELDLSANVQFVNHYIPLNELLEYLQLTDIYLFTSKDPYQAVSGTFAYAMSCGCPIISTPIPHAREVLNADTGIIIDFQNIQQLAQAVNQLLVNPDLSAAFRSNSLQGIAPTAWENSAIAHALLIEKTANKNQRMSDSPTFDLAQLHQQKIVLNYRLPVFNLEHVKKMTSDFGMIQFSKINQPDIESGYTIDDNARAMIALCMHYEVTKDADDLVYLGIYLNFIGFCLQPDGNFLNYVDVNHEFTDQNYETNLSDANGRAIWALGFLISKSEFLPADLVIKATKILNRALVHAEKMHSTRSMAFVIKGIYYSNLHIKSSKNSLLLKTLAQRLLQMYRHEAELDWQWFESYLTYANSILPEALLCAWLETGNVAFRETALASFEFLLSKTFDHNGIKIISNKTWLFKGQTAAPHGEQPIDVAYTILTLGKFYEAFQDESYLHKMKTAFNWFLGKNHLHQIIYNPCTGGCYDGLEETQVNLNQGAESTLSYLLARLTMEKHT